LSVRPDLYTLPSVLICPRCGEENPDKFRLCGFCGTSLVQSVTEQTVRRTVSVVFCDLKGSTTLGERLDSESLFEVLSVYFDAMRAVVERHGGTVEKYIGDAIMAVFGHSAMHEDDALRAVRAASEMRTALVEVNERLLSGWGITLENRTGVNTGEIVSGDPTAGQRLTAGDTVNVAARLEQAAPAGEVLVGEATYRLVQHAVVAEAVEPLELKGKSQREPAYRLISVHGVEPISRRTDTPMVGRVPELELLRANYRLALEQRTCWLVTILAQAGFGKSRLMAEFGRELVGEATVLSGRCLSYGEGITFWPLAEVFRQAAGIDSQDSEESAKSKLVALAGDDQPGAADRLATVMGLSSSIYGLDETMWAARTLLEEMARRRPLVVVFDDIHWAEATFLDLVENIVDASRDAGFLVVCAARHDLVEDRPSWMVGRVQATSLELNELSLPETALVARHLLGDAGLPEALEERILGAAGGNPLFVEQMISMIIDDGLLVYGSDGIWTCTVEPADIAVPTSVALLLASRFDRLTDDERSVLQRGSVIGQVFYPAAVKALGENDSPHRLAEALRGLGRKKLIRPAEASFAGEPALQFAHILVRDAAYQALLKRSRAGLHERFAGWLLEVSGDRVAEHEEIVGYHLEQAVSYRAELGRLDDDGRRLAARAAGHLASAGERALARQDMPTAASLLLRAAALLEDDGTKARLLIDAGGALIESGELVRAGSVLDDAIKRGRDVGDDALETSARLARLYLTYSTDPQGVSADVVEEASRAIEAFTPLADHDVLLRAWRLLIYVNWTANLFGPAEEALGQFIFHAEAAGDHAAARRSFGALAICALYGPSPVPRAVARCEELLARAPDERKASALARCALARLEAMRGNFDRARTLYRLSRGTLQELGWSLFAALTSIDSGPVEMLAGDPQAAEAELRGDYEALGRMGERNYIATTGSLLAEALYRQGRLEEADDLVAAASEIASADDVAAQTMLRCVAGKLLAQRGRLEEAERLVREAIALVDATDHLDAQGSARLDLAEVYLLGGRDAERVQMLAEAAERFEQKGNVVSAMAARTAAGAPALSGETVAHASSAVAPGA